MLLGPHKQHLPTPRDRVVQKALRLLQQHQALREIDDVDAVAFPEDVALHLGVPPLGLVAEMQTRVDQVLYRDVETDAVIGDCHTLPL